MTPHEIVRTEQHELVAGNTRSSIPRIDVKLWDHKIAIGIAWTVMFTTSGVLPILLYFVLRYVANLSLSIVLAVTTSIFGLFAVFSILQRTWRLMRVNSTCRPLGASRGSLDYFQWNFLFGFCAITAIIVVGNITKKIRIVTLGLPILLLDVCGQILIAALLHAMKVSAPFRMSSVAKGQTIRSGVYAIAEDIVAVDGQQGQHYRRQLEARYLSSSIIRSLCFRLDLLWGFSGVAIAAACIALIFGLSDNNIAYIMGWAIPWGYAVIMALITIWMVSAAVDKENRSEGVVDHKAAPWH